MINLGKVNSYAPCTTHLFCSVLVVTLGVIQRMPMHFKLFSSWLNIMTTDEQRRVFLRAHHPCPLLLQLTALHGFLQGSTSSSDVSELMAADLALKRCKTLSNISKLIKWTWHKIQNSTSTKRSRHWDLYDHPYQRSSEQEQMQAEGVRRVLQSDASSARLLVVSPALHLPARWSHRNCQERCRELTDPVSPQKQSQWPAHVLGVGISRRMVRMCRPLGILRMIRAAPVVKSWRTLCTVCTRSGYSGHFNYSGAGGTSVLPQDKIQLQWRLTLTQTPTGLEIAQMISLSPCPRAIPSLLLDSHIPLSNLQRYPPGVAESLGEKHGKAHQQSTIRLLWLISNPFGSLTAFSLVRWIWTAGWTTNLI